MIDIDTLVDDLAPVKTLQAAEVMFLAAFMALIVLMTITFGFGLRTDVMAGSPNSIVIARTIACLMLGASTLAATAGSIYPGFSKPQNSWKWMLGLALLFPLATLWLLIRNASFPESVLYASSAPTCLMATLGGGLLIGGAQTLWLKRAAPLALDRVGWLVGLSSGSLAAAAYGLHCPSNSIEYVGLWYALGIWLSALAGRLIVPRAIRW